MLWYPSNRAPEWLDWQAWSALMQRAVSPWELVQLRRIHDAYFASAKPTPAKGEG